MAETIKIEIYRQKNAEEFTAALADPDSRLETGSGAAATAAVASAFLCRAAGLTARAAGENGFPLVRPPRPCTFAPRGRDALPRVRPPHYGRAGARPSRRRATREGRAPARPPSLRFRMEFHGHAGAWPSRLVPVRAFDSRSRVGVHVCVPLCGCEEGASSLRNLSAIAHPLHLTY